MVDYSLWPLCRRVCKLMEGGNIVIGGDVDESERYIAPTVLRDCKLTDTVMQEEVSWFQLSTSFVTFSALSSALMLEPLLPCCLSQHSYPSHIYRLFSITARIRLWEDLRKCRKRSTPQGDGKSSKEHSHSSAAAAAPLKACQPKKPEVVVSWFKISLSKYSTWPQLPTFFPLLFKFEIPPENGYQVTKAYFN